MSKRLSCPNCATEIDAWRRLVRLSLTRPYVCGNCRAELVPRRREAVIAGVTGFVVFIALVLGRTYGDWSLWTFAAGGLVLSVVVPVLILHFFVPLEVSKRHRHDPMISGRRLD
jgi:hypothetical protein